MGRTEFWKHLLKEYFHLEPSDSLLKYLNNKEDILNQKTEYKATVKVKSRRISNYISTLKREIEKQNKDKRRGATYLGKGEGLNDIIAHSIGSSGNSIRKKSKKHYPGGIDVDSINQRLKCGSCGGLGHCRRSSKLCDQNHATKMKTCPFCGEIGHINPFSTLCLNNPLVKREIVHDEEEVKASEVNVTENRTVENENNKVEGSANEENENSANANSANVSAMNLNDDCTDEQTAVAVDLSPEIYSPACREIQLIDECLFQEDDEILREIDDLFDQLTL